MSSEGWDLIKGLTASVGMVIAFFIGRHIGRQQVRDVFHKLMRKEK